MIYKIEPLFLGRCLVKSSKSVPCENLCEKCVALCCRYFALEIDKPTTRSEFDDLRWYLLHGDCAIYVDDGDWYLQVNQRCKALLPNNRCGIYERRPTICRSYTTDACDWQTDAYQYEHLFTSEEQLEAYACQYLADQQRRAKLRKAKAAGRNGRNGRTAGKSKNSKTTRKRNP